MAPPSALEQIKAERSGQSPLPTRAKRAYPAVPKVGLYARISDAYESKDTGVTVHAVQRQLKAGRLIAQARGWDVARQYVDNHVSAFKANVVRDAFEDLLEDLESGVIDGIVCYNLDRFCRQVTDLERAISVYDSARLSKREMYFATTEGDLNLASDDGLTMARVMVAFANKASRDTARRVALKQQDQRDKGEARFGGVRPTGLDPVPNAAGSRAWNLNRDEANAIRWAAKVLTEGSMNWSDVTREWNARGLSTPEGNSWTAGAVKAVMRSPRLAGWLVHRKQIAVNSQTGKLIRATNYPAILKDDQFEALLVATEEKRAGHLLHTGGHNNRTYLLTGVLRCGECGAKMAGQVLHRGEKSYRYYTCRKNYRNEDGKTGCNKVAASAKELDAMVSRLVGPRVIADSGGLAVAAEKPHVDELLALQNEKDQLLSAYRDEQASSELVFPRVTKIEHEIETLRRLQAEWLRDRKQSERSVEITPDVWQSMPTSEKSRHIAVYVEAIYVSAATKRLGNRFDPSRVSKPVWRKRS